MSTPDNTPTKPQLPLSARFGSANFSDAVANFSGDAKRLAMETWQRRVEWCEQAYTFWASEYSNTGDTETRDIMRAIEGLWEQAKHEYKKFASAQFVGEKWLTLAVMRA